MKRKKLRFQYCTALFATTLLVGTNCAVATASELENIETRAPAFTEDAARNAMNDAEELKVSESPPNKIAKTKDTIPDNKNPIENLSETLLKNMPAKPDRMLSDSGEIPAEIPAKTKYTPPNSENPAKDTFAETEHMNFGSESPIESTPAESESTLPSENSPESTPSEPESIPPSSENSLESASAETEGTPPSSESSTESTSAEPESTPPSSENPTESIPTEPESTLHSSESPTEDTSAELESTPPSSEKPTESIPTEPESTLHSSENPTEDTSAETESTPPSNESPIEGNSTEPEGTDSDCENTIEDNSSPPVDSILDSEHTIPVNTLPDLEETKALIDVNTICAKIDTLPTVDQLYANVSGVDDAGYDAWQSAIQELHRQILELQEQYHLLTTEEQALVGDARKAKLEALGILLEEGALFKVDELFDIEEDGLSYKIIIENDTDKQVSVTTSSNYGALLSDSIRIPSTVEHNGLEYRVTCIDDQAFKDCMNLTSVSIPDSVQSIGKSAFYNCPKLTDITIPSGIQINSKCFGNCTQLSTMKIIVAGDTPVPVSVADANAFQSCPAERQIIFQTPDGTELSNTTTPSLASVVNIYKAIDDGNKDDYFWYGWKLKAPTYIVIVNVLKDSNPWQNHDRTFALKSTDSGEFVTDLNDVKNGKYLLYDITNVSTPAEGLNTKIPVEVKDGNITSNPVEYYTVSFYDNDRLYDTDTPQAPQIILKDNFAVKPATDPVKDGYIFEKWVTTNGATTEFEFNSPIASQTNVYASWKSDDKPDACKVTIEVYLDGKKWTENCTKTFALKATDSGELTSNLSAVAEGQYDIYEISAGEIDTNVDVTISGADASARIDYYTVQFVDENVPYGNDTPQKPQIILKEQHASEPEAPTKEGFIFAGWKEILESDLLYDFENITITNTINLYATWTPADSGDKPDDGEGENKPGDGENKPGDGDNQQPGDGENKPDDGEQPPGGNDQKPGDGENKPDDGEQPPDSGDGENKPGDGNGENKPDDGEQAPGDGENKPDDGEQPPGSGDGENKPGDGEQPPSGGDGENKPDDGEQPPGGGDNQQPGDEEQPPGGDDQQPDDGENKPDNGDGENKPGDGEQPPDEGENKPGNGDDQKPGDGENKPGGGDNQKPDNGNDQKPDNNENKPDNGNQQPPEKDSGQNLNKTAPYSMDTSVNTSTFMVTQTTALPSEENAINSSIPNEVITDYSSTSPVKDKEPQTGDESSTGIYSIVAMLASIVLALLHFAEHADIKELLQSINAKHKYPDKRQRASIPFIIHKKLNVQSSKKKDRTLNGIWTRRKQYYFLSG